MGYVKKGIDLMALNDGKSDVISMIVEGNQFWFLLVFKLPKSLANSTPSLKERLPKPTFA